MKIIFGVIVVGLVLVATFPAISAWGRKAKDYFLESFKK